MSMWRVLDRISEGRFAIALGMLLTEWISALCALPGVLLLLWCFSNPAANINGVSAWFISAPLVLLAVIFQTAYVMLERRPNPKQILDASPAQKFPELD